VARWIFDRLLESGLPHLQAVEVRETCTSSAYYQKSEKIDR
jgi:6-pyruvoyltetrahydropterin/6-carboxytetrahydropterin synthase